jgi:ABC-2 type transport system ATP-binding protein
MLSARKVVHRYRNREALQGLDLEVSEGEIFGLLGPNGGGKTTLFRLLAGLLELQSGELSLAGFPLPKRELEARSQCGILFQSPSLDKKLSVRENLACQGALYGLSGKLLDERIEESLERLKLTDRRHERAELLSGGLQRRVEIAKALLHRPRMLIMDEPSTGLDPGVRADLWKWMAELRASSGMTIVLTTHLLEEAEWCGRIAILNEGRIACCGSPKQLKEDLDFQKLSIETEHPADLAPVLRNLGLGEPELSARTLGCTIPAGFPKAGLLEKLEKELSGKAEAIHLQRPSLEDVFARHTGQQWKTSS